MRWQTILLNLQGESKVTVHHFILERKGKMTYLKIPSNEGQNILKITTFDHRKVFSKNRLPHHYMLARVYKYVADLDRPSIRLHQFQKSAEDVRLPPLQSA